MSNHDKILQARIDIETALDITNATLSEVMDNMEDDRYKYIILGVLEQIEKIEKAIEILMR